MKLSDREMEIAERYAGGSTYKDIAAELHIAASTVRNHLAAVYRKMSVRNKPELIRELSTRTSEFGILPPAKTPALTSPLLRNLDRNIALSKVGASVAVMPFDTIGAPGLAHIAYGISADIQHDLTRSNDLFVSGRNSALALHKDIADVTTVSRKLGVQYVLQGNLRSEGEAIRLTAELIHGSSGAVLWSQRYNGRLNGILEMEAEISREIAANLSLHIKAAQFRSRRHLKPDELSAYDLRLRGNRCLELGGIQNLNKAKDLFSRSIEMDPGIAAAYAGLSMCFGYECDLLVAENYTETLKKHLDLAGKAIAVDETDSRGHYAIACGLMLDGQFERADEHSARAVELNPGEYHNICNKGYSLMALGRFRESASLFTQSLRRNPLAPNSCLLAAGLMEYLEGNYGQAARALSMMTGYPVQRACTLAASCAQIGYESAAQQAADEFIRLSQDIPFCPTGPDSVDWQVFWQRTYPYLVGDAFDHMREGLRKASLPT